MKRTAILVLVVGTGLVVALLLLASTYAAHANLAPLATQDPDLLANPPRVLFWTRWVSVAPGLPCSVFSHNLGRDPKDYVVELWFLDLDDGWGLNRRYYGGTEESGNWYGAWWQELTTDTIKVCRGAQDSVADKIMIRIWVLRTASRDYDSGWRDIQPGQTLTFPHRLGGTVDLAVCLWFSETALGIHHFGYGGLAIDSAQRMEGAHWHHLTDDEISMTRHPGDTQIAQVRMMVVHTDLPAYYSMPAPDDWQDIAPGTALTFEHNLNWDADRLRVRTECSSTLGGISQWFAGGNHGWINGWQGANIQNLTDNTVQIYRQPNDEVCPQVRVRIWTHYVRAYLPLVLKDYSTS